MPINIAKGVRGLISRRRAGKHLRARATLHGVLTNPDSSGERTVYAPAGKSEVIAEWVRVAGGDMPDAIREGREWQELLVRAARAERLDDYELSDVLLDHTFGRILPLVQPTAEAGGYGAQWSAMSEARTVAAAETAAGDAGRLGCSSGRCSSLSTPQSGAPNNQRASASPHAVHGYTAEGYGCTQEIATQAGYAVEYALRCKSSPGLRPLAAYWCAEVAVGAAHVSPDAADLVWPQIVEILRDLVDLTEGN